VCVSRASTNLTESRLHLISKLSPQPSYGPTLSLFLLLLLGSVSSKILSSTQGARVHAALHTPDVLGALCIGCDSVLQRCCLHRCSVAARVPAAAIYKCPHATNVSSFYVYISVMCILTDRHAGCSQAEHCQPLSPYLLAA
jgi:hypothetical protein